MMLINICYDRMLGPGDAVFFASVWAQYTESLEECVAGAAGKGTQESAGSISISSMWGCSVSVTFRVAAWQARGRPHDVDSMLAPWDGGVLPVSTAGTLCGTLHSVVGEYVAGAAGGGVLEPLAERAGSSNSSSTTAASSICSTTAASSLLHGVWMATSSTSMMPATGQVFVDPFPFLVWMLSVCYTQNCPGVRHVTSPPAIVSS
jgi:hypothetical protein